jgi:hypothetical protein
VQGKPAYRPVYVKRGAEGEIAHKPLEERREQRRGDVRGVEEWAGQVAVLLLVCASCQSRRSLTNRHLESVSFSYDPTSPHDLPLPVRVEYPIAEEPFCPLVELLPLDEIVKVVDQDMPDHPGISRDDLHDKHGKSVISLPSVFHAWEENSQKGISRECQTTHPSTTSLTWSSPSTLVLKVVPYSLFSSSSILATSSSLPDLDQSTMTSRFNTHRPLTRGTSLAPHCRARICVWRVENQVRKI